MIRRAVVRPEIQKDQTNISESNSNRPEPEMFSYLFSDARIQREEFIMLGLSKMTVEREWGITGSLTENVSIFRRMSERAKQYTANIVIIYTYGLTGKIKRHRRSLIVVAAAIVLGSAMMLTEAVMTMGHWNPFYIRTICRLFGQAFMNFGAIYGLFSFLHIFQEYRANLTLANRSASSMFETLKQEEAGPDGNS